MKFYQGWTRNTEFKYKKHNWSQVSVVIIARNFKTVSTLCGKMRLASHLKEFEHPLAPFFSSSWHIVLNWRVGPCVAEIQISRQFQRSVNDVWEAGFNPNPSFFKIKLFPNKKDYVVTYYISSENCTGIPA